MSILTWSVESAVLGLWALALSSINPNPFHTFIARAHVFISAFTLAVQLLASARLLPIHYAVAEAFVCTVFSLFLMYLVVLFDSQNYTNNALFSFPVIDRFIPLDGCICVGWFCASIISALGMSLSERGRATNLMFHRFGYHMLIVPPSFLALWLYNYNANNADPISHTTTILNQGVAVSRFAYTMVLIGIWGVYIVLQATGECILFGAEWPATTQITWRYVLSAIVKFLGRAACILIPVSALFSVRTAAQIILFWVLIGIGVLNAYDWLQPLNWMFGTYTLPQTFTSKFESKTADPAAVTLHFKDI